MIDEPLVRALAEGEAVAFVGSGVSIPSGLPNWRDFLKEMLDYAQGLPNADWTRTSKLLDDGDFLLAAEMLQRELPLPTFTRFIEKKFARPGLEPNDVHRSIARLPFCLAITTNIDNLLEAAYRSPPTCSWRDPDAVFNAIRSRNFAVVKLHGSVSDPLSTRLTRTHYRDGTLTNPEFNECIKDLLTWKTFLFVGYSLRDSDLLYLIDEARLRFGRKFGPHYAIMPADEADLKFQSYLKEALSIETIPYERDKNNKDSATAKVVGILKDLAGRVSEKRYGEYGIGVGLNDPSITRNDAAQAVLEKAAPMTGSMRGDVCMIQDDIHPKLARVAEYPRQRDVPFAEEIAHDSIIESVFLQAAEDAANDFVYIKDVSKAEADLRRMGYRHARYETCETAVKCELACPIIADGRRIGTLNFESNMIDAYTQEHIRVATRVADELGRIYLQSEQRRRTTAPIEEYHQHPERFANLMSKSRLIHKLRHDFLLYVIDYENKILKAKHTSKKEIEYRFDERSLAKRVFETRSPLTVQDAEVDARSEEGWTNEKGVGMFNIRGPLFACPVRAAGQTEAVLVTWLRTEAPVTDEQRRSFPASSNQARRLANLLANDTFQSGGSRAESFLNGMYGKLEKIDFGKVWVKENLQEPEFCSKILDALLQSALLPEVGLKRVRIWVPDLGEHGEPVAFRVFKWMTTDDIQDQPEDRYVTGEKFPADDVYTRYTISRYHHDPFAKWQHPAMFPERDARVKDLDKDPDGSWIVAPIVKVRRQHTELMGFLSADMHVPTDKGPKDQRSDDPREIAFQSRVLDVISDLAQYVLGAIERPWDKTRKATA
jgi:hypothetical protein